ncbi:MAG: cytochrome ubiquinol oxidase subunit I, partial [Aeromonas veronii]
EWETEPAPAAFTLFGIPNQEEMRTDYAIKIPYALGIIATRSLDGQVTGLKDLKSEHELRVRNGMTAYDLLTKLQSGDKSDETRARFDEVKQDLGYGLLLKRYTSNVTDATDEQIKAAVDDSIPQVLPLFFAFRIMVAVGMLMLVLIGMAFYDSARHQIGKRKWLLKGLLWGIPLPWIAIEAGWFVAEYGRQPWTIAEVLPTSLSASNLPAAEIWFSLIGICLFYTVLLVIEMYLMFKYARLGPSSLKTGKYHFEQIKA